jgi:formylglycine-generating enzyme required for sulfatase activity
MTTRWFALAWRLSSTEKTTSKSAERRPAHARRLAGNVSEWVFDYLHPLPNKEVLIDPKRSERHAKIRVRTIRGGNWAGGAATYFQISLRSRMYKGKVRRDGLADTGFRVALSPNPGSVE